MRFPNFTTERLQSLKCEKCGGPVHADDIRQVALVVAAKSVDMAIQISITCPACGSAVKLKFGRQEIRWREQIEWLAYLVAFHEWNDGKTSQKPEEPSLQFLKVVTVLDVQPGRSDAPEIGDPIAIITLEHAGEVEQPLMLRLRDVHTLAGLLLRTLAHFNDEKAQRLMEEFYRN